MKIRTILYVVILSVLIPLSIFAQPLTTHEELTKKYLAYVEQNSFEEAANLFHYPSSYSFAKKQSEFNSVKDALKRYKANLGSILQIIGKMPQGDYIGTGVSGAEIDYWNKIQNQPQQIILPCRFQNLEFCVIRIVFCEIQDKIEIQSVDYSFIRSENSITILKGMSKNEI